MGPSLHDAPSDGEYVYTRGRINEWEHVRGGSRHVSPPRTHAHQEENPYSHGSRHVSLPRTHTHQEQLRDDLERTHTHQRPLRDYNDSCRTRGRAPPDHYYRDLGILHSRCDQLSLALAESRWGGRSPVIASPRVAPPSDAPCHPRPDSSSL